MVRNPSSVFNSREDHFRFAKYIEQLDEINLSKLERTQISSALNYLIRLLGDNFLEGSSGLPHPFYFKYLWNSAPWVRRSLLRFTSTLRAFESSPDFVDLLFRIRRPDLFREVCSVLEIGNKFRQAGFSVRFDQCVVTTDKWNKVHNKKPDLQLTDPDTGEDIYVEITQLGISEEQMSVDRTFDTIWRVLRNSMYCPEGFANNFQNETFYLPYSRIHRSLSESELSEVVTQINAVIEQARLTGEFQELNIEGTFELAIAPPNKHRQAEEWAKARNISEIAESPLIPLNGLRRAKGRIFKKIKQLPANKPGIVVVHFIDNLTFWAYDAGHIIVEVAEEVEKHAQLTFAVMVQTSMEADHDLEIATLNAHARIKKMRKDGVTEQTIIINNSLNNVTISESTHDRLMLAVHRF